MEGGGQGCPTGIWTLVVPAEAAVVCALLAAGADPAQSQTQSGGRRSALREGNHSGQTGTLFPLLSRGTRTHTRGIPTHGWIKWFEQLTEAPSP